MPSLASGNSSCTAWAITWAVEWRRMSRPSGLSIATGSTSSPSASSWARSRSSPPTRAAITSGVSEKSSHALVPVVTVWSSRAPACTRTTLIWDTGGSWRGAGVVEPGDRIDAHARPDRGRCVRVRASDPSVPRQSRLPPRRGAGCGRVGDTGFEPVTSSVPTAEPRYHCAAGRVGWAILGSNQ